MCLPPRAHLQGGEVLRANPNFTDKEYLEETLLLSRHFNIFRRTSELITELCDKNVGSLRDQLADSYAKSIKAKVELVTNELEELFRLLVQETCRLESKANVDNLMISAVPQPDASEYKTDFPLLEEKEKEITPKLNTLIGSNSKAVDYTTKPTSSFTTTSRTSAQPTCSIW